MAGLKVQGRSQVIKNLNRAIAGIEGNTADGINDSLKFIAARSSEVTPVENFNLIKSIRTRMNKRRLIGVVGYLSKYAASVHESPGKLKGQLRRSGKGRYWDVSGTPKFLQKTVIKFFGKILSIIKKGASKKPI